jgi:hypothetical protein
MAVVVALLALVLTLSLESFSAYERAAAGSDRRQEQLAQGRLMMAVLTKDLRTATKLTAIGGSDVTFLATLNTAAATSPPNQLRLYVDAQGRLVEAVTPPDDPAATPVTYTGTPTTRVVGTDVAGAASLFTFKDSSDQPTTTPGAVASVALSLSVSTSTDASVPPTTLTSQVWLPNVAAAGS